jgi:hypothetical protein
MRQWAIVAILKLVWVATPVLLEWGLGDSFVLRTTWDRVERALMVSHPRREERVKGRAPGNPDGNLVVVLPNRGSERKV